MANHFFVLNEETLRCSVCDNTYIGSDDHFLVLPPSCGNEEPHPLHRRDTPDRSKMTCYGVEKRTPKNYFKNLRRSQ